jgi:uncharacterized protein (TIRG00374 family)
LKQLVRVLVSVSLLGLLAWRADWSQIADAFTRLRTELWLAAVALYGLAQVCSAFRWRQLAEPLGFRCSARQYVGYYFISMFFNLFLPTAVGGDVVRALYLNNGSGRRLLAFLAVLMDRLSGLLVLLVIAAVATVVSPVPLSRWVTAGVSGTVAAAIFALASLPILVRVARSRRAGRTGMSNFKPRASAEARSSKLESLNALSGSRKAWTIITDSRAFSSQQRYSRSSCKV